MSDALQFIAAWSGFVGRNTDVFSLVGKADDIDAAKAKQKIAVIMGLQNADEFREPKDVKAFYELGLRCAQLTYNSAESARQRFDRTGRWRHQRLRRADHQGDERGGHAHRRLAQRRSAPRWTPSNCRPSPSPSRIRIAARSTIIRA